MASLFVANPSKQDHDFIFLRVENKSRVQRTIIPQGGQIELRGLSQPDIEATVEHHRLYGARDLNEVKRAKHFVPTIYSDHEIKLDGIRGAAEHNVDMLVETGKQLRQAAAVVADRTMLNASPEGTTLNATNVDVIEVAPKAEPDRDQQVNEQRRVAPKNADEMDRRGRNRPAAVR